MARTVTLDSRLPEIIAGSEARAAAVVGKTAFDIEAGAKRRSRVDTGHMRNAWTTQHLGLVAAVYNSVEYAPFHEWGTEALSAQPMLIPSVEEARIPFEQAIVQVFA